MEVAPQVQTPPASAKLMSGNPRLQLILMVVAFVLFAVSVIWGISSGNSYGKSVATYNNVDLINQALAFYFKDQSVYPSPTQFKDDQVLRLLYLSAMPKPEDVTGVCANFKDFIYSQTNPHNFTLQFCLLQSVNGWPAGVNVLKNP